MRLRSLTWAHLLLLGWLCVYALPAQPQEQAQPEKTDQVVIRSAATTLVSEVYVLNADIQYQFSPEVLEALENGVPLTMELNIEIRHPRRLLWDAQFTSLQQRYRIEYHALSQQYIVKNVNSGIQYNFPSRPDAIDAMGTIIDLPILDKRLLEPGRHYFGRLRASLDIEALPTPLLLLAYLSPQWHLTSEWYTWPL
ncbi:MAG: DUF4390 domain-containing protein [Gammaproteobacteria bacterium]